MPLVFIPRSKAISQSILTREPPPLISFPFRESTCAFCQQAAEQTKSASRCGPCTPQSLFPVDRHPSIPLSLARPPIQLIARGRRSDNWIENSEIKYWRLTRASEPRGNQQTPTSCCLPFNYMAGQREMRRSPAAREPQLGESRWSRNRKKHKKYFPFSSIASFYSRWWCHL